MKKEELIEDYLVYTDNGIERVHWCNVNGVKELVSPKGNVYGYVPDYFEVKRLQEQLAEANKLLRYCCANYESSRFGATITEDGEILPKGPVWNYLEKLGVK